MRRSHLASLALGLGLLFASVPLFAQAPAGSTGVCGDGTYTKAKTKTGACSSHGGVKEWYNAPAAAATAKAPARKSAPAATAAAAPAARGEATGTCNDGTSTMAKSKQGACSAHGGVKDWFASGGETMAKAPPAAAAGSPAVRTAPVSGAPVDATALCNDGSFSQSQHRSGTCSSHKGVKQWLKDIPA